ncbi:MAG: hypothetical protein SNJ78_12635, partial [Spirochaetales bacterium]
MKAKSLFQTLWKGGIFFLGLFWFWGGVQTARANPGEITLWQKAVQIRSIEETYAPLRLRYLQYQLEPSGKEKSREEGVWAFSYNSEGKASIQVVQAIKDGEDFTEERKRRLNRGRSNANRMLDILSPFDSEAQAMVKLGTAVQTAIGGKFVWEFPFELPRQDIQILGVAWVDTEGKPVGFRYTIKPLPWFIDRMDIQVLFHLEQWSSS